MSKTASAYVWNSAVSVDLVAVDMTVYHIDTDIADREVALAPGGRDTRPISNAVGELGTNNVFFCSADVLASERVRVEGTPKNQITSQTLC